MISRGLQSSLRTGAHWGGRLSRFPWQGSGSGQVPGRVVGRVGRLCGLFVYQVSQLLILRLTMVHTW